jgi:uncharacterized peroxidase-related enzyme
MAFVELIAEAEASGDVAELYESERARLGSLPNFVKAFSQRPAVYVAWRQLINEVLTTMDTRRFELVTLAAARRLRSSYCSLAHGKILVDQFIDRGTLRDVATESDDAGLDRLDLAVMALAAKVVDDATSVTADDIEELRSLGLTDADITDVVLAASARCFFSKTLDALGVQPDAAFAEIFGPELQDVLVVGRPIATA